MGKVSQQKNCTKLLYQSQWIGQEPNRVGKGIRAENDRIGTDAEREREDTSTAKEMAFTFSSGEGMRHYASERRDWNGESGTDECIERVVLVKLRKVRTG